MKIVIGMWVWMLLAVVLMPALIFGGTITATAVPQTDTVVRDQTVAVPINIEMSTMQERLGSYSVVLRWNCRVLQLTGYQPGTSPGFIAQIVNDSHVQEGYLRFNGVNPHGAAGTINILNVLFLVIGKEGEQSGLQLEFTAMAAAHSFIDLLPYYQSVQTGVAKEIVIRKEPQEFTLDQNYPNPFNPSTKIGYSLPQAEHVSMIVYNAIGQRIKTLVDERKAAGHHAAIWDGTDEDGKIVPNGAYVCRYSADSFVDTIQMVLMK